MRMTIVFAFVLFTSIVYATIYPMEYVRAELQEIVPNNVPEPIKSYLHFERALAIGPVCTGLDDLTGFALLLEGELPGKSSILAEIYWSPDGEQWLGPIHDWEIEPNEDEGPIDERLYSNVFYTDRPAAKYYRANFYLYSAGGTSPEIRAAGFVFMDCGWTDYDVVPVTAISTTDWPMPTYVNRGPSGWNCAVPDTFNTGTPTYYTTITHVTIHHTAGATTTPSDPCAQMRNIWSYHVLTRGWSDIGYNFILDHLGNIYQGRYSADLANLDVRAAHCSYHNANVMGFSVMGNFDVAGVFIHEPTWPALYDLITWKCSQRDIDPYGTEWNGDPGYEDYAPCILGHKDWSSAATACPGMNFHPTIPTIRDTIAARLSGTGGETDSFIVDNGDPGFGDWGTWIEGTYAPELAWDLDYQYCTAGGAEEWARWTPTLPYADTFDVYIFWIAGSNRTDNVMFNIVGGANDTIFLSQQGSGAAWHHAGRFWFESGDGGYVQVSDQFDDAGVVIADAVMWISSTIMSAPDFVRNPTAITLSAYPNPFNSSVTITLICHSGEGRNPEIEIFDINGRMVAQIPAIGSESAKPLSTNASGACRWQPDAALGSGVYLVRVKGTNASAKVIYMK